ncbi:unnamed protein product [Heligmosomoides polygyrus]|uniref:Uncharacterized protein n=1 Tax=Heligmosomoides polygyrus TaxID=6339 RepID=A0A183FLR7_HELPZ|nr:unnamed protein product [Heligmosomoides polygyrus]
MLADFDRVCGNVELQLSPTQTMLMRNGRVSDAPFSLNGTKTPRNALHRHPLDESRHLVDSAVCQENTRTPTNVFFGLLRESPERPICSSWPSSEEDPLEHSGARQGRMETLLAPTGASR